MEAIAGALEPRQRSTGWIVAPSLDLVEPVFRLVQETLERHLPHRVAEVVPREHRLVLRNLAGGLSEVRAKSADHAVSLLGEGLDWLIGDEAARLRASVWESHLSQRLIDKHGWALLISTPRGRRESWFHGEWRRGQGQDPEYESWNRPSWTNPFLDRAVIERERGRLEVGVFGQEYGAEFLGDEPEGCAACGGQRESTMLPIPLLGPEDEERDGPARGFPMGPDGRSLLVWTPGRRVLEGIRLRQGEERSRVVAG